MVPIMNLSNLDVKKQSAVEHWLFWPAFVERRGIEPLGLTERKHCQKYWHWHLQSKSMIVHLLILRRMEKGHV